MRPVVTVEEMRAIDAGAPEPVELLIERSGWAVAQAARRLLGGTYGRRVGVLHGRGNNGADGRAAARILARAGVRVDLVAVDRQGFERPPRSDVDLVIDAAFGTGFAGELDLPPVPTGVPVLAVDVPSGLHGDTGEAVPGTMKADHTVTLAAPKPGLFLADGPALSGRVEVADIGLDCSRARIGLMERTDVARWPRRSGDAHKWEAAIWLVGGSAGMTGAATLAARAAFRSGAGYVTATVPGGGVLDDPIEAVSADLTDVDRSRHGALIVGPGLADASFARIALSHSTLPAVVDAGAIQTFAPRAAPTVLTPHWGEFTRRFGASDESDRIGRVREAARQVGAVVLLKGSTTVVGAPDGQVRLIRSGDARLATAGTGDVLSGIVGAGLAMGLDALEAASIGALIHGLAATRAGAVRSGFVAGDLPALVAEVLDG